MKILVVDDDKSFGHLFQELIKSTFGIACDYISSPKQALEAIPRGNYFLVFSDLQMPEMDGFQFQAEVSRRFPNIPLVLISGSEQIRKIQEECEKRKILFLKKPVVKEKVAAIISLVKIGSFYSFDPLKGFSEKAAIVAISNPQREQKVIEELRNKGYTVFVPFGGTPDLLGTVALQQELLKTGNYFSVEIVTED